MGLPPPITKREKMVRVRRKLDAGPHPIGKKAVKPTAQLQC